MDAIRQLGKPITQVDDVRGVKHIGKKSITKIDEIIRTGKLEAAQQASVDPKIRAINKFSKIHGVGMVKARELVLENNILTIEDLKAKQVWDGPRRYMLRSYTMVLLGILQKNCLICV